MASIELKNVTKIYEGFKALDALNLTVPSGSVYGLIGPNGAGKTTAIRHMMGVLRQDAGSVLLDGEPVFENPSVKARMLCIPDEPYFTSTSTTRDLMKFTRALYPRFDTERYEKLREIFALDDTRPIRRLSRGMQKQSAFWIALAARPEVLVLDEPVDGLDPVMRRQVWSLVMEDVAEEGMTVLVSSHNLRELEDVCDHVASCSAAAACWKRAFPNCRRRRPRCCSPCRTARRCRRRDWIFSTAPRPASCRRSYCAAGKRTISRGSKSCTRCSWIPCR